MASLKDALIGTASYLPPVNHVFNQWRSFAHAKLPFCGLKNVCAISSEKNAKVPRVLVASADGFLYIYDLNANEGGECTLIKQHKLEESSAGPSVQDFPAPGETPLAAAAAATAVSYASALRGLRATADTPP